MIRQIANKMMIRSSITCYTAAHSVAAMLDEARFYQSLGFSQLPLHGKEPALRQWKHLTERHPTDEELVQWFRDARHNIGIICGAISGVVVFDADTAEMVDRITRELPPTDMRTRTAKGEHFFYRLGRGQKVPPRVRVNQLMLDVRGEASYVVAAPSIHPDTGQRYEQIGSWDLAKVPVFSPEWIPAPRPTATGAIHRNVKDPISYIAHIQSIQGQGGSNSCFRAVCILRDAGGFDQLDALAAMIEWNNSGNAIPKWSIQELTKKVRDVFSKPSSKGAQKP